jgi:AcrR family transcriptional regulator
MPKRTNTKRIILEKSADLFAEKGYYGASIREIAKMVGIRESAIYNHYSSKDEIFKTLISYLKKENYSDYILTDKLLDKISKPEAFLNLLASNILNFLNEKGERSLLKILLSTKTSLNDFSLSDYILEFENICVIIFKEMINYKFLRKTEPETLAHEFVLPLIIYQIKRLVDNIPEISNDKFIHSHVEFFWQGAKRK